MPTCRLQSQARSPTLGEAERSWICFHLPLWCTTMREYRMGSGGEASPPQRHVRTRRNGEYFHVPSCHPLRRPFSRRVGGVG